MVVIFIGALLNMTVIVRNGGKMPVRLCDDFISQTHFSYCYPNEVVHYLLSDIIDLLFFSNKYHLLISVGDVIMFIGFIYISFLFFKIFKHYFINLIRRYKKWLKKIKT